MLKVVNFFSNDISENSKILETFTLKPLTNDDIRVFNNIVIKEKEKEKKNLLMILILLLKNYMM
jgi:hypothetical protein